MWSSHTELSFHSFADVWFKTGTDPQRGIASPFAFAFVFLVSSQRRGTVMELNVEQVKVNRGVSSFSLTENYWCQQVCHLPLFYSNINFHRFKAKFDVSWSYMFKVDLKRSYWIRLLWIVESAFHLDLRQNLIHFNFNPNLLKVFELNYF